MDVIDFLMLDSCSLPKKERQNSQCFLPYIRVINSNYINSLQNITSVDALSLAIKNKIPQITLLSEAIESTIDLYMQGKTSDAYVSLKSSVTLSKASFESLYTEPLPKGYLTLYRMRESDDGKLSNNDMFHIPFGLRHKCSTQRYSIAGHPSLYAGSSSYIAWKELGMPSLSKTHISKIEPVDTVRVLDFGYTPLNLIDLVKAVRNSEGTKTQSLIDFIVARLELWPLIASCSVRVLYKNEPFKPEYIVPQLLLQLVRENDEIDGIRYFSMHYDAPMHSLKAACNFVFPSKTNKEQGFCNYLSTKLKITHPLSWQISQITDFPQQYDNVYNGGIELVKGVSTNYMQTDFARIEARLNCFGFDAL